MQRYRLDILGVSETHWIQSGQKKLRSGELVLFSGKEEEGVAVILSKRVQRTLRGWEAHGSRLLLASFSSSNRGININILQLYAPTNAASEEEKEEFYDQLQRITEKLPRKDVNIIMGDANAKVGSDNISYEEVMGKQGLGVMNDNGERFADFCSLNDLVIGGTIFPHKDIHKATWVSPDGGTENQIDHICISRKFRRSLQDVRVFRGADIGSDHHLVITTFQLKLERYSRNPTTKRLKFQEVLGEKDYKHKDWISQESLNRLSERREKKAAVNNSRTRNEKEAAQREYSDAAKEVKRSIKNDKEAFTNELAERAEKAAQGGHMRTLYETTKVLAGKRKNTEMPVKDAEGNTIFSQELQMTRWVEHFESLLNRPPPIEPPEILPARNDLDINCDPPTLEEIENAVSLLNSKKAAGPDYIPPEALKADSKVSSTILHGLFEKIWTEEKYPNDWKEGHLVKIPKKGDLSNCNNYRGITLLSIPGKVFTRILLERIKETVDDQLRDNQAGFRKNRSCTDQIAALRIIVEQSIEWNSPLLVNFIDFEKAFDSIDRDTLWKLLRHYGIPPKIVTLIQKMCDGTSCKVLHEGRLTDSFQIKTGV
ncbi:hypothetical protein RRG08_061825 [Elysia crispata]|uniref:Reverse transcriptase domain-containing protein n=1 Tax=Elysia crispata TaxID=231223 RepID=A0AAE1A4C7_9GAST|nr:hypothetical protein RRG08_061825 [Elysia crispata]